MSTSELERVFKFITVTDAFCVQVTWSEALLVAAAAIVANLCESYLGAVVQGQVEWLTNDLINMIQITVAAALAIASKSVLS